MGIMERIMGKKDAMRAVVVAQEQEDVHAKYEAAISEVLLREMGNNPKMIQLKTRIMMAIKTI